MKITLTSKRPTEPGLYIINDELLSTHPELWNLTASMIALLDSFFHSETRFSEKIEIEVSK